MKSIAEIEGRQSEHFKNKYNSTKKNKKRVCDFRNFSNHRRVKKRANRKINRGNKHWDANAVKNRALFLHTKLLKSLKQMETNKGEEKKNFLKNWNMNYLSNNFSAFMKGAESVAGDRSHSGKNGLSGRSAHSGNRCFLSRNVDPERGGNAHNESGTHGEGSSELYSQGDRYNIYVPQQNSPNFSHTTCKQVQGNAPNVNNLPPHEYIQSSTKEHTPYGDIRGVWEKIKSRSGLSNFVETVIQDGVNAVSEKIGAFSDGGYEKNPSRKDDWGGHVGSAHYSKVKHDPTYGDQSSVNETYHIASSNNRTTGNSSSQNKGNGNNQHSGKGGSNTQSNYNSKDTGRGTNSNNYHHSGNNTYNSSASGYTNGRTPNGGGSNDNNNDGDGDDDGNNGHYGGNGRCDNNGESNDDDHDDDEDDNDDDGERSNGRSGHQNERVHDPGDPNGKMYYSRNNGSSASVTSSYINTDANTSNSGAMKHQCQKKRKSGRTSCPTANDNNNGRTSNSASSVNFIGGGSSSNGYGDYNSSGVEYANVDRRTNLNLRRGMNDGNVEYYNPYRMDDIYDRSATEAPNHNRGNYDCSGGHYRDNYASSRGDDAHGGNTIGRNSGSIGYANNGNNCNNNISGSGNDQETNLGPTSNSTMSKNIGNKRNYGTNVNYEDMCLNPSYAKQGDSNSNNNSSNSKQIRKGQNCGDGGDSGDSNHGDCNDCADRDDRGDCGNAEDQSQKRLVHAANSEMLNPEDRKREAEKYKVLGNQSYKLGYFESAIDYYTKAISYDNTNHVYYTNRALCYKKQKLWKLANSDARQALNLEEESVKAHFILGLTLLHLNSLEEGLKKLTKAKTLSSYLKDSNESEINRYILQAKKLIYLRDEQNKQLTYTELQSFLIDKINLLNQIGYISNEEKCLRTQQTENLFKEVLNSFQKKQIPDYLCCKISMCLMNEPVITPSGMTYDKIFLYEHVKHNGSFDPVSREQFSMREVIPNYAIKEATDNFLKCNPWAFEE